jgi:hypothetical protein
MVPELLTQILQNRPKWENYSIKVYEDGTIKQFDVWTDWGVVASLGLALFLITICVTIIILYARPTV